MAELKEVYNIVNVEEEKGKKTNNYLSLSQKNLYHNTQQAHSISYNGQMMASYLLLAPSMVGIDSFTHFCQHNYMFMFHNI